MLASESAKPSSATVPVVRQASFLPRGSAFSSGKSPKCPLEGYCEGLNVEKRDRGIERQRWRHRVKKEKEERRERENMCV